MALKDSLSLLLVTALLLLPLFEVSAQGRDPDGTRMQARQVETGSTHRGSLTPPHDRADWRMVRLDQRTSLHLALSIESGGTATLTLTDSTGDRLNSLSASPGDDATLSTSLDAGIYYIAVESSEALRYDLTIR